MKLIHYTFRTLLHAHGKQYIKIITLSLGLLMSLFLSARVAFELSYDNFYREAGNLYVVKTGWKTNGVLTGEESRYTIHPIPGVIAEACEEVESSSTSFSIAPSQYWLGNEQYDFATVLADTSYLSTLGLPLLEGNGQDLATPDVAFLSESAARRLFGAESPVGKTVLYSFYSAERFPLLVKGVFADVPLNNSLNRRPEIIVSYPTFGRSGMRSSGWNSGGNFDGYVRLHPDQDVERLNERLSAIVARHIPPEAGLELSVTLAPVRGLHLEESSVTTMLYVMFLLGAVILFATTLNYVLLSISSLMRRAKAVGVHKCNGATDGHIFLMFMLETQLVLLAALALVLLFVFVFRDKMEELVEVPLSVLFAWSNLWAPMSVLLVLLLLGGGVPALLFARIPVTQVFRRYTAHRKGWKQLLLFVQFACAAFILGMLLVVFCQYRHLSERDRGWSMHRVVTAFQRQIDNDLFLAHLRRQPYVEAASSAGRPIYNLGGWSVVVDDAGNEVFSPGPLYGTISRGYLSFIGLRLQEGREPQTEDEIAVNSTFCRKMGWTDSPLGKRVNGYGTVVGLLDSFALYGQPNDAIPVVLEGSATELPFLHVRLKEPFDDNLLRLNGEVKSAYPQLNLLFSDAEGELLSGYRSERIFRDVTAFASLSILFIILMGLVGYVDDETQRRSKEIAIRKVNGAEASGILLLLSRDILWMALPSVLAGSVGAYYAGRVWMSRFADVVALPFVFYCLVALLLLLFILGVVLLKVRKVAADNPVKSLKTE